VPAVCALGTLSAALRHWRSDLVEARRQWRVLLVGAGVVYSAVQLAARLSTPLGLMTPALGLLDVALLLVVLGGWALAVLRLPSGGRPSWRRRRGHRRSTTRSPQRCTRR
jgi:hypothetical protein